MYKYLVVPFMSSIKEGQSAKAAADQLQRLIDEQTKGSAWELDHVANVNMEVRPGCLSALFGAKSAFIVYNQVIFRRPV